MVSDGFWLGCRGGDTQCEKVEYEKCHESFCRCVGFRFGGTAMGRRGDRVEPRGEGLFCQSAGWRQCHFASDGGFCLSGMGVAPAGTERDNTGHHHLFIDRPAIGEGEDGVDEWSNGIPADEHHLHFGGGQTEAVVALPPGQHSLQLVLGDLGHVPHATPIVSEVITITVAE